MQIAREGHVATLLENGLVLVAGGIDARGNIAASAELYNPVTGTFTTTGSMGSARYDSTLTLLPRGDVLAAGGANQGRGGLSSAELYDPATGTWSASGRMTTGRYGQSATLLQDGQVLVAGNNTAEMYNPATGKWTMTGDMPGYHQNAFAPLLPNGEVLVVGGDTNSYAELYNLSTGQFTAVGEPCDCDNFAVSLLGTGKVLVAGGTIGYHPSTTPSAEIYNPSTQAWAPTGSLITPRDSETMTTLLNGQALVSGGEDISNGRATELATAELYTP